MLPFDPVVVAVALLALGVVASVVPLVPGGLVSTVGVVYYWFATGDPGTAALLGLLTLGVVILLFDWFGSSIAAGFGGASTRTMAVAAVAAALLLVVLGPLGALLGIAGTVFALEYRRHGDVRRGVRTATYATIGTLASAAVQVLLTGTMLVAFLLIVVV